jgi:hypothetical protein
VVRSRCRHLAQAEARAAAPSVTRLGCRAFGVLLWELASKGQVPYGPLNLQEIISFLLSGGLGLAAEAQASRQRRAVRFLQVGASTSPRHRWQLFQSTLDGVSIACMRCTRAPEPG